MEWFWYIIASIGAGVGTGLAGLSAATVMVPILIVLCPSFAGETGAYQAWRIYAFPHLLHRYPLPCQARYHKKKSYRERLEIRLERDRSVARLRYSDWLWHRLCRHWRRYDDADRFHGVLRYGTKNGGRNERLYYDLYGAHRIGRSYYDPPGERV